MATTFGWTVGDFGGEAARWLDPYNDLNTWPDQCAWGDGFRDPTGIGNPNDRPGLIAARVGASPRLGRQARVGALIVTAAERNEMNAQVLRFRQDVDAAEAAESVDRAESIAQNAGMSACRAAGLAWDCQTMQCVQQPDPQGDTYRCVPGATFVARDFRTNRLTPFLLEWDANLTSGSAVGVANFEKIKADFTGLVAEWRGLGFETAAVPPPVRPPGDALETVLEWLPWVLGGAALLVGGIYLAPVLLPAIGNAAASLTPRRRTA